MPPFMEKACSGSQSERSFGDLLMPALRCCRARPIWPNSSGAMRAGVMWARRWRRAPPRRLAMRRRSSCAAEADAAQASAAALPLAQEQAWLRCSSAIRMTQLPRGKGCRGLGRTHMLRCVRSSSPCSSLRRAACAIQRRLRLPKAKHH